MKKRIKNIILGILTFFLVIILVFNIYNFVCIKVLHKDLATVNGYAVLEVISRSMEPTIKKGDMIIINTKAKDYKVNDIITFRDKEGSLVTHKIISLDEDTMITKGDNNNTEDGMSERSAIVGKYVKKIAGLGVILASLKSPITMVMIFVIGVLVCFLLSTDKDGNLILDSEEKEFQEFLKMKEEKENKKEDKELVKEKEISKKSNSTKKNTTKKSNVKKKSTGKKGNTKKKNTSKKKNKK